MANVVYAQGDDWNGLYVDGVLMLEDHRLHPDDVVLCLLGQTIESFAQGEVDLDWMADEGSLPVNVNEVKWSFPPTKTKMA